MKWSQLATIFLGVLLIAIITPLSQFLTIATLNMDIETATPVGWAVGLVFSLVLVFAFFTGIARLARLPARVARLVGTFSGLGAVVLVALFLVGARNPALAGARPFSVVLLVLGVIVAIGVLLTLGWWAGKNPETHKQNLVILYVMLTLAAPLMNLGLIRPVFLAMTAVNQEYVFQGTNTYRTAYSALQPNWFPVVPTTEGLAWNKADRLLQMLDDTKTRKSRQDSANQLRVMLKEHSLGITPSTAPAPVVAGTAAAPAPAVSAGSATVPAAAGKPATPDKVKSPMELVSSLGSDDAKRILEAEEFHKSLEEMGLIEAITKQQQLMETASAAAAEQLPDILGHYDEFPVSLLPSSFTNVKADLPTKDKIRAELSRMDGAKLENLKTQMEELATVAAAEPTDARLTENIAKLRTWLSPENMDAAAKKIKPTPEYDKARKLVAQLSETDFRRVRDAVSKGYLAAYQAMPRGQVDEIRWSFVYRLSKNDRNAMMKQDGKEGTVNQNIRAFEASLYADMKSQKDQSAQARNPFAPERVAEVSSAIPWSLWLTPMLMWGLLFASIFLLLMCLAEWLRRKWIDRENLAFPLVEIADNFIRHDSLLEVAEDPRKAEPRRGIFSATFIAGVLIGALMLFVEALQYYNGIKQPWTASFDVSTNVFKEGFFRDMSGVAFVLSPILLGIAFLVSLEVSFSVWVIFILYKVAVVVGKLANPNIQDSIYVGYGGSRFYPFPMEQLLGAALCFTVILVLKSLRTRSKSGEQGEADNNTFIPAKLNTIGLVVLPLIVGALLWNMGIRNIPFLLIIGAVLFVITIAGARTRAETGLHTQHVFFDFTRLPLIFGLTGMTGAKVFAAFTNIVFLPGTLLFRTLPQHLENMELARRHKLNYRTVAVASMVAFLTAVAVGMACFLIFSYFHGNTFFGTGGNGLAQSDAPGISRYPLWVTHFLGETTLDKLTNPHWVRIIFMLIGLGVFGFLALLRGRFLSFPLHPIGYILVLFSIYYEYVSTYYKGDGAMAGNESWLWGTMFVAWAVKKLIIKYGGMNAYKTAKPLFIGLVVGAVACTFFWNMTDLVCSYIGLDPQAAQNGFIKMFVDRPPFSPRFY